MIDLQVNGYAGIDFNRTDVTLAQMRAACQRMREDGVTACLPTVITADPTEMATCLANVAKYHDEDDLVREMVAGVHIEGPFLSPEPGYIGAHPSQHAVLADRDIASRLLESAGGLAKIVTLAPEQDPDGRVTRWLADQGIVVAAGHCNPTRDELTQSLDSGLSMFTHLGNGCPLMMHRHDNVIQRVLSLSDRLWVSLIADGAHLPWFTLLNFVARIGESRLVVVSDAISAAGLGPGRYSIGDRWVDVGDDLVPRSEDRTHFVGAATPMGRMAENLRAWGLDSGTIDAACRENPRRILAGVSPSDAA